MSKATDLVVRARELARSCSTWADLSNALFDPVQGILARAFATRAERQEFIRSPEYREIQQMLADAVNRFGLVEGATPTKVTEFMVQLQFPADGNATTDADAAFRVASQGESRADIQAS